MMTQSRLSLITVPHSFQAACEGSVICRSFTLSRMAELHGVYGGDVQRGG